MLFFGSGISRRYGGAEDWEGLLRHFATKTDRPYEYYKSKADGDLPAIATAIAEAFGEVWWDRAEYKKSRERHAGNLGGRESPLKVEVAEHLAGAGAKLPKRGERAKELALLRQAVVDAVITTNYDDILPTLFPDFTPFIGQDGLLFSNAQGIGEIYQIHGSVVRPDSLVLTAADYQRFNERNAYLAAKLMTIFVEHPIIFVGYSLSDPNVRSILRSIAGCLTQDNIAQLQDQLLFVEWQQGAEPAVGPHTFLIDDFVLPVLRFVVPDFLEVFGTLASLTRSFPAKLLRRLKEQVYELVLTDDPHKRLVVADISDDTPDRDVDVVFGVGMRAKLSSVGLVGLTRDDLIDDVVGDRNSYPAQAIVDESLPHILSFPGNVPVHKYLRGAGVLDRSGHIKKSAGVSPKIEKMAQKIANGLPASAEHRRKAPKVLKSIDSLDDLIAAEGVAGVFNWATCMDPDEIDPDELRAFLTTNRSRRQQGWLGTQYIKLVCLLDWLENGRGDKSSRKPVDGPSPRARKPSQAAGRSTRSSGDE